MRVTLKHNLLHILIPLSMQVHVRYGCYLTTRCIVSEILKSPAFGIESPRAGAVLECAKYIQSVAEQRVLVSFCDKFYTSGETMHRCSEVEAQL